jgi:hypothetical protein
MDKGADQNAGRTVMDFVIYIICLGVGFLFTM